MSSTNSSEPTTKWPSASICQTKRNGWRRSWGGSSCGGGAGVGGGDCATSATGGAGGVATTAPGADSLSTAALSAAAAAAAGSESKVNTKTVDASLPRRSSVI